MPLSMRQRLSGEGDMIAGTICSRVVATAWPGESVRTAARRMEDNAVGTLVVVEAQSLDRAVGILTDRDIAIRCVAHGLDPENTPVSRVMTSPVHTVDENAPVEYALTEMAGAATRRLIVTGKGEKAVGVLSLDDLLGLLSDEAASLGQLLEKQRPHVTA